jgi:hypothetical protein
MINTNSIYWINPEWNLYRLFEKLLEPIKRIVAVSRSGLVASNRDYSFVHDGIIKTKGVALEGYWTATGTGTAVSCAIVPKAVTNSYLMACIELDGVTNTAGSINTPYIGTSAMASLTSISPTFGTRILIAGLATAAGSTFTCSLPYSGTWRVIVYQFSGVNTTSSFAVATPSSTTGTSLSISLASYANSFIVDSIGANLTTTATSGQTVAYANCSGILHTDTSTTTTVSYSTASSTQLSLCAVALNPA